MGRRPARALALAALVLVAAGCRAAEPPGAAGAGPAAPDSIQRAFVVREDVDLALACEESLASRYDAPPGPGEPWVAALPGGATVLVTAPHATAQTREGQRKTADAGTGSLAVMLNALAGTPALYTTRHSPSDPNFYDDDAFKRELDGLLARQPPRLVLDLHASHPHRPYDVDFGTMRGASLLGSPDLLPLLVRHLRAEGLASFSRDYFAAAANRTVTRFVAGRGVPAVQLEINAGWLLGPGHHPLQRQRFAQLLQGLVRFVAAVDGRPPARRPLRARGEPCAIGGG